MLRLRLGRPLQAGQYRLFWKATSDATHEVQRKITPLRIDRTAKAPKNAPVVVVSNGKTVQSTSSTALGVQLLDQSTEQAFLYATYHDVRGFVLDGEPFDPATVRELHALYPGRAIVVKTSSASVRKAAVRAGASTLPATATAAQAAALVAKLDR
jgi:hypothetical protein